MALQYGLAFIGDGFIREAVMPVGTVCFYNMSGGFGVILPDGGGNDAFVHASALEASRVSYLEPNQRVRYVLRTDARGQTCAHDLLVI